MKDNFIGAGEDTAVKILVRLTGLEIKQSKEFHLKAPGIYRQIQIPDLLSDDYKQDLAIEHGNSSVDIVCIKDGKIHAVRVQGGGTSKQGKGGHYGDCKSAFDAVQRTMLEKSGVIVHNIWRKECPNIFKERLNEKSIREINDAIFVNKFW